MVSSTSILFMTIAFIIQFFFPIALAIYFYRKEKISIGVLFTGVLVFLVSQIIIRIPLLKLVQNSPWYQNLAANNIFLVYLLLSFTAGLFEESGRYLGFKFIFKIKNKLEWKSGLALGIGHGGLESIYISTGNINNIIISLMINAGTFDSIIAPLLPSETVQYIKDQLINTQPALFLAGGLERLFTMFIQIGLSMIVLYSVKNRKAIYLLLAIILHTLVNLLSVYIAEYFGVWGAEIFVAILAATSLILIFKSRKYFEDEVESI